MALLRCYASWVDNGQSKRWCDDNWVKGRSLSRAKQMRDLLLRSLSVRPCPGHLIYIGVIHSKSLVVVYGFFGEVEGESGLSTMLFGGSGRGQNCGISTRHSGDGEIGFSERRLAKVRQALCYGLYMRSAKRNRAGGYQVRPAALVLCSDPRTGCTTHCNSSSFLGSHGADGRGGGSVPAAWRAARGGARAPGFGAAAGPGRGGRVGRVGKPRRHGLPPQPSCLLSPIPL
jgi:hypothetical protein